MAIFFKDFPCLKTSKPSCIEKFEALRTNQVEALHSTSLLKMPLVNFLNEEPLTLHVILTDHFNQKIARKFSQVEVFDYYWQKNLRRKVGGIRVRLKLDFFTFVKMRLFRCFSTTVELPFGLSGTTVILRCMLRRM